MGAREKRRRDNKQITHNNKFLKMAKDKFFRSTEFEKLAKLMFESMMREEAGKTLSVQHNAVIMGKSTSHQIDVLWKFQIGDVDYTGLVQCKNWSRPIPQGEILKFKEILNDVPCQPRGIFVSRSGYQQGALEVAQNAGLELYVLREPRPKDLIPISRAMGSTITMNLIHAENISMEFDDTWVKNEKKRLALAEDRKVTFRFSGFAHEMALFDVNDKSIGTVFSQIENAANTIGGSDTMDESFAESQLQPTGQPLNYVFDIEIFVRTGIAEFPRLKVKALKALLWLSPEFGNLYASFIKATPHVLRRLTNLRPGVDNWWFAKSDRKYQI